MIREQKNTRRYESRTSLYTVTAWIQKLSGSHIFPEWGVCVGYMRLWTCRIWGFMFILRMICVYCVVCAAVHHARWWVAYVRIFSTLVTFQPREIFKCSNNCLNRYCSRYTNIRNCDLLITWKDENVNFEPMFYNFRQQLNIFYFIQAIRQRNSRKYKIYTKTSIHYYYSYSTSKPAIFLRKL